MSGKVAAVFVVAVILAAVGGFLVATHVLNTVKSSAVPDQDKTDVGGVNAGGVVFWATAELQSIGVVLHSIVYPQAVQLSVGEVTLYIDSPLVETGLFFATILLAVALSKRILTGKGGR